MVSPANAVQLMKLKKSRDAATARAGILTIFLRFETHDNGRKTIF